MRVKSDTRIRIGLLCAAGALVVAGAVVALAADQPEKLEQPLPLTVDLTNARHIEIRDASGQMALSGDFTDKKATLTSTTKGKGSATIDIEHEGKEQEFQMHVDDLAPAATYHIVVDGQEVSTFTTGKDGDRDLKLKRKVETK